MEKQSPKFEVRGLKLWKIFHLKTQNLELSDKRFHLLEEGVTIIEALIVMGIIGFVMSLIFTFSYLGVRSWQNQTVRAKLIRQAQDFTYVASYQLRQAQQGTVIITNYPGEASNSLITFTPIGKSNPVSIYMRTVTQVQSGVTVSLSRQVFFKQVTSFAGTPTVSVNDEVLATDVASLYFTYPDASDDSRVLMCISLRKQPLKTASPVDVQQQETVNIRN